MSRKTPGLFVFRTTGTRGALEPLERLKPSFKQMEFFLFMALFVVIPMLAGFAGGVIAWSVLSR